MEYRSKKKKVEPRGDTSNFKIKLDNLRHSVDYRAFQQVSHSYKPINLQDYPNCQTQPIYKIYAPTSNSHRQYACSQYRTDKISLERKSKSRLKNMHMKTVPDERDSIQTKFIFKSPKQINGSRRRMATENENYSNYLCKIPISNKCRINEADKNTKLKNSLYSANMSKKNQQSTYNPLIQNGNDVKFLTFAQRSSKSILGKVNFTEINQRYGQNYLNSATKIQNVGTPTTPTTPTTKAKSVRNLKVCINFKQKTTTYDFHVFQKLGQGRFGSVYKILHKQTGAIFALKKVKKDQIKTNNLINQFMMEIKVQLMLNNPNVLKLYGFFDDENFVYLIVEYMANGTLYKLLKSKQKLIESEASKYIYQILSSLTHLHSLNIAHRDIKPQNIVMMDSVCKICDFGSAAQFIDRRKTVVGTTDYACPQVINGEQYGLQIDLWCLGILCYQLLIGKAPFYHNKIKQTIKKIVVADTSQLNYENLSEAAKDFINKLIVKDPESRMALDEAINHQFIKCHMQVDKCE